MDEYLQPTYYLDFDHPDVQAFVEENLKGLDPREAVVRAYYYVRDEIGYNPYRVGLKREQYKSSYILGKKQNYCIPKAVLFASLVRAVGVPSRIGLADVVNHLSSERFIEKLGSKVFAFHGFAEVYLDQWLKATPTFDKRLCVKYGVAPLEFDGRSDAMFQSFDEKGNRFMEYVKDRGGHADLPFDTIMQGFREFYPNFVKGGIPDGNMIDEKPAAT